MRLGKVPVLSVAAMRPGTLDADPLDDVTDRLTGKSDVFVCKPLSIAIK